MEVLRDFVLIPTVKIAVLLFLGILPLITYLVLAERKVLGYMQARLGPNRVGPWGILQPIADVMKLLVKEDVLPAQAPEHEPGCVRRQPDVVAVPGQGHTRVDRLLHRRAKPIARNHPVAGRHAVRGQHASEASVVAQDCIEVRERDFLARRVDDP